MKIPRTANAVGHIDEDLVVAATAEKQKKGTWLKWAAVAACVAVIAVAALLIPPLFSREKPVPNDKLATDSADERYKAFTVQELNHAILWPWEDLTTAERFTLLTVDGTEYSGKGTVSETLLDGVIGTYTAVGYDEINNVKHTAEAEVYTLKNVHQSQFVAAKIHGSYLVFQNNKYDPPATLGKLFEEVDLLSVVELSRFAENGSLPENKHYVLNDDSYVWQQLSQCKDAPFVEDDSWSSADREFISFTVSSEVLGVYKVGLYITEDGYLWTNVFGWQYLYEIGESAAGRIISYAKENSKSAEYEPYSNTVVGKITEIRDGFIFVDDSILCKNPADGITYRVAVNGLHLSRYVDKAVVKPGDTVQVYYRGEIDTENLYTINSATAINNAIVSYGDVYIPE